MNVNIMIIMKMRVKYIRDNDEDKNSVYWC